MSVSLSRLRSRGTATVVGVAVAALGLGGASPAGAIGVDTGFGTGGVANHGDPAVADAYFSVVAAPGGGTYTVGYTTIAESTDRAVLVTKADANGVLDPTFGTGEIPGRAVINLVSTFEVGVTGGAETGRGIAVDATGRILVLGDVEAPQAGPNPTDVDVFVARLSPAGKLDTSFGAAGVSRISLSDGAGGNTRDASGYAIFVRPDRTIVFAAAQGLDSGSPSRTDRDIAAVQLRADGSRDTSWGENGVSVIRKSGSENLRFGLLDSKGRYLATAYHNAGSGNQPFIYRWRTDGKADTSFGDDGIATGYPAGATGLAEAYGISEQSGKYVISAYGRDAAVPLTASVDALLFRFTESGELDRTFGTNGLTYYGADDEANPADRHRNSVVLPDGRIVAVGSSGTDALISVTLPEGQPDTSFSPTGYVVLDLGGTDDVLWGAARIGNGYQVVASGSGNTGIGTTAEPRQVKIDLTPVATTTAVKVAKSTAPYGAANSVTVTLAGGGAPVAGAVTLTLGSWSKAVRVPASGTVKVALPKLGVGAHKLTATFAAAPGLATSKGSVTVKVTKATSTAAVALSKKSVKVGKQATASVKVSSSTVPAPTGTIRIYDGSKVLKTYTLTAAKKGTYKVLLPKLAAGSHAIKVVYSGSGVIKGATSKTVVLKVTK